MDHLIVTERELAEILQRYFRRFVTSARIMVEPESYERVVTVEFEEGAAPVKESPPLDCGRAIRSA